MLEGVKLYGKENVKERKRAWMDCAGPLAKAVDVETVLLDARGAKAQTSPAWSGVWEKASVAGAEWTEGKPAGDEL